MSVQQRSISQSLQSTNLADLLERVLDKGLVIAGDIKVKLADIELLTIQIRLVVCSVDKAREIGIDWWTNDPMLSSRPDLLKETEPSLSKIEERLSRVEASLPKL